MQILRTFRNLQTTIKKYWQGDTNSCHLLSPTSNRINSDNKSMGSKSESITEDNTASASTSHIKATSSNYTQRHTSDLHYKQLDQVEVVKMQL